MILQPYGTTIAVAVLVGAYVTIVEARRRGLSSQLVWEALPWVLVFGLVGARAYHICHLWEFYRQNPLRALDLGNGGLGIYGGFFGGIIGLAIFTCFEVRRDLGSLDWRGFTSRLARMLDVATPGVAIAQAIGRFANFFSQELYGWPTDWPWGIYIAPENRFPGLENYEYFHPLFLYEALWCLLGLGVLAGAGRLGKSGGLGRLLTGERFLLYLSFYAVGRFFLESMRIESWMVGGVRVAQVVSVVVVCGSIGLTVFRRLRKGQLKIPNFK